MIDQGEGISDGCDGLERKSLGIVEARHVDRVLRLCYLLGMLILWRCASKEILSRACR